RLEGRITLRQGPPQEGRLVVRPFQATERGAGARAHRRSGRGRGAGARALERAGGVHGARRRQSRDRSRSGDEPGARPARGEGAAALLHRPGPAPGRARAPAVRPLRSGTLDRSAVRMFVSMETETRYARSGDVSISYQVTGDGPFDVVHVPGF